MLPARDTQVGDPLASISPAQFESLIEEFEKAWAAGTPPTIDTHLSGDAVQRQALLIELVHADLEFRLKAGQPARVEEYLQRYPMLNSDSAVVLDLVEAEYVVRRVVEDAINFHEYQERFPDCSD